MCAGISTKFVLLVTLLELWHISAYNLSPVPNLVLKRPNFEVYKNKTRSSYFGFTLVLREKSAFISAPREQPNLKSQSKIDEPGAVYKCAINLNELNSKLVGDCKPFIFESRENILGEGLRSEIRDNQWLGAAMVGGAGHNEPFVVCAPRFAGGHDLSQYESYMQGACYLTLNTSTDQPIVQQIKNLNIAGHQNINGGFNYQLGQQGFSAHVTKDNQNIVMGAPGVLGWKGTVIRYNQQTKAPNIPQPILNHFSYFGYDVSSGYFESRETKKILYAATSIHSTDYELGTFDGEVIVFDYADNGEIERKFVRHGAQFGELFGYALLVEDVTDDRLDDLIVSAPLHEVKGIEVGAVYVYVNDKGVNDDGLNFRDAQVIVSPFKSQARFGTTMATLGDMNKDGYNDIAISAPFADGHGAVVIYLGGPDGLQTKPSIILGMQPPIEAKMFGHGLSNGFDIDGNGFNDLAVGAPDSELVYIYRAYPIVYVEVSIKAERQSVEVQQNETLLELEFCYKINTKAKKMKAVELTLEIRVDPVYKRMVLDNGTSRTSFRVRATADGDCQYNNMTIKNSTSYIFTPMTQHINFTLVHDAKKYFGEEFCDECVMLDSSSRREATSEVRFKHGCAGKACEVDLKVSALKVPSTFVLGTSNTLFVTFLIENFGENAYYTNVEFSSAFPLAKIPPNCRHNAIIDTKLSCSAQGSANFIGNMTIELGFDVKSVQHVKSINITANASSEGHEKTPENNFLNTTIIFEARSAFEIMGQPNKSFESVYDENNAKDIIYRFEIQNNGPSALHNAKLVLLLPFTFTNKQNETIRFIDLERSRASLIRDEIQEKSVFFSKKLLKTSTELEASNNTILSEYVNTEAQISTANNTISLFCNQSNAENYGLASLTILAIKPQQKLKVNLFISVDPRAVRKLLDKKFDYLQAYIDVFIEPSSKSHVTLNMTKIINPLTFVNIGPEETPIWVYIAAAIGGVLFLLLLILALKKLGFFKRQTKEEMEELINEKIEKQRMQHELEYTDNENVEKIAFNEFHDDTE